jgi:predicted Zn-dependent protease with MMP-like domain
MPNAPTILAALDRAWTHLSSGDIESARREAQRVLAQDPKNPEAHHLLAEIAIEEGDLELAGKEVKSAISADPEYFPACFLDAYLAAEREDYEAARAKAERALEVAACADDAVEARLLLADAHEAMGEEKEARHQLLRAAEEMPEEPALAARLGAALLECCGEPRLTRALLEPVARACPGCCDARYYLGRAYQELGEEPAQIREFLAVYDLEAREPAPPCALSRLEFMRQAENAFAELPKEVRERLSDVAILAELRPPREQVARGLDPRLMGLFDGPPLHERALPSPVRILLFQRNIENACASQEEVCEEIATTLLHEIGHYLGLSEEDLFDRGLD